MSEKYPIVECCPNCEEEVEINWNVEEDGYEAVCPYCGERLMLCDECMHSDDYVTCDYCEKTNTCFRRKERPRAYMWRYLYTKKGYGGEKLNAMSDEALKKEYEEQIKKSETKNNEPTTYEMKCRLESDYGWDWNVLDMMDDEEIRNTYQMTAELTKID